MKTFMSTTLIVAVAAGTAMVAGLDRAPAEEASPASAEEKAQAHLDRQVELIESVTEIDSLAVVTLRRASPANAAEDDQPEAMSAEDILLSGVGSRRIMTGDDADAEEEMADTAPADDVAEAEMAEAPDNAGAGAPNGALQEAIARNRVLSEALAERDVDLSKVAAVEVRDGTSVIVYVNEG